MAESQRSAWPKIAERCIKEYNETVHSVTKFSPTYLMTGEKSEIVPPNLRRENDLELDRKVALQNSIKIHEKNKKRVDVHRKEFEFKPGDLVLVHSGKKLNRNKLAEIRTGPHKVIRRVSNSIYEIAANKRRKESNFFHSRKLTPFLTFRERKV